jgi:hypothetical protein
MDPNKPCAALLCATLKIPSQSWRRQAQGHSVVLLGQETAPISLGTPGSSPAPEATLERGAPRDNQAKTEN